MLRVLVDSNAFNSIALDAGNLRRMANAISAGRLQLVVTHVQVDEVKATPDEPKRKRLLRLSSSPDTATAGLVLDVSASTLQRTRLTRTLQPTSASRAATRATPKTRCLC